MKHALFLVMLLAVHFHFSFAQTDALLPYTIGTPVLRDVWVDPVNGSDAHSGDTREQALATVSAAWDRIPQVLTDTGYHVRLLPGTYPPAALPNYWESKHGTFEHPIIFEAAEGRDTVTLASVNIFDAHYLYFIHVNFAFDSDPFHCELCNHLLLRGARISGAEPETYNTQETLKVNQSQYVYIEDSDISGAWDNAVDFVAVQHGHFLNNRIHKAGDWCMYVKGGSAYFRMEGNELYDCGTGGFTAGQGTGFQFMVEPWTQYEAYDIRFVNNLIHDTQGAGVGVQGGYNILIANNTLYRVGERSHVMEFGFGSRSCDGTPGDEGRERCDQYREAGGWGDNLVADGENYVRIPNRNVFVYNNLIYNPPGFRSAYQHFFIPAPYAAQADANLPNPARADDNLQIRGNLIWNGDASMPLGIEADFSAGCQSENTTCNEAQLRADNAINSIEPHLIDPDTGNYALAAGSIVPVLAIPAFTWDVPVPAGP